MGKQYKLDTDLRILHNGKNELRIRMGLWNYNEATISLNDFSDNIKEALVKTVSLMKEKDGFNLDNLKDLNLNNDDLDNLKNLISELENAGMIYEKGNLDLKERINQILLGDMTQVFTEEDRKHREVLFVTDCAYSEKLCKDLCNEMNLKINIQGSDLIEEFSNIDAVTNIDALKTLDSVNIIKERIKDFDSVVILMTHINMSALRNLNRTIIELNKPVVVGMIDGPFITVFSVTPPATGCIECYEQRILARLEDHYLYNKYVKNDFVNKSAVNPSKILLSSMLTNLLLSESLLLSSLGATKFEGRVLSIFIPTLEIQVQDILRVPYCPACGHISKSKFEEMNVKSRVIIDEIIKDIKER